METIATVDANRELSQPPDALAWRAFEEAYHALNGTDGQQRNAARQELREALKRLHRLVEDRRKCQALEGLAAHAE